jgi:hypothetical protein
MRVFTQLDNTVLRRLLALPFLETKEVRTIYSDEGIFDVHPKLRKWCIKDAEPETVELGGRTFTVDRSTVEFKEAWQIPLPNVTDHKVVTRYRVNATTNFIVEQSDHFCAYFDNNDYPAILTFLAI